MELYAKRAAEGHSILLPYRRMPRCAISSRYRSTSLSLDVVEQSATLTNQHQEPTTTVMVLFVDLQVFREVRDASREERNLDLGRTGVGVRADQTPCGRWSSSRLLVGVQIPLFLLGCRTQLRAPHSTPFERELRTPERCFEPHDEFVQHIRVLRTR